MKLLPSLSLLATFGTFSTISAAPLPIAPLTRTTPVDFEQEVMPFMRDNCVSCHCKTTTKGGLNLESPELIIKGGDTGPGLKPGNAVESLLLQAAAHLDDEMKMPPRDNKAKAMNLTPEQLALLKLWIDQGAKPSPKREKVITWQPLPPSINAIFAVTVTPDGQFAACARANRISFYHLPTGQLLSTEVAHRDQINALASSPDGSLLASGAYREVKLWRRAPEAVKLQIADAGTAVAVSPDGKWIATGREDGSVKLWSLSDGKPGTVIAAAKGAIRSAKFSTDSTKLACASADKSISVWNVADGKSAARNETPAEVNALAWLGDRLASAGADGIIRVWDSALANPKEMPGHTGAVTALDSLPAQLISGGADGTVRLWDLATAKATIQIPHGGPVTAVGIRADGKRLASAGENNLTKLWDTAGKPVAELRGDRYAQEAAAALERAQLVATGTVAYRKAAQDAADKQVKTAQERSKKAVEAVPVKKQDVEAKQKALAQAKDAKMNAEKALAAADADLKRATEVAEAAEKAATQAKTAAEELKAKSPADQPAIDKANAEVAAKTKEFEKAKADRDQRTAQRKQAADKIEPLTKPITDAEEALKKAATAVVVAESEIKLGKDEEQKTAAALTEAKVAFEAAEKAKKKSDDDLLSARTAATATEKPIRALTFSPNGQTLATAGDDMLIHTWSAESGAAIEVFKGAKTPLASLAFAPGGQLVSAAHDRAVTVRDITPVWKFDRAIGTSDGKSPFADRVQSLAFSPDGRFLAIGGGEPSRGSEIKLWDTGSGDASAQSAPKFALELTNIHSDAVLSLDFSPDGKFLASGAADKIARVTDLGSGKVAKSFEGHTHHVLGLSWSLDGRTLATAGADNVVKIWDFTTGDRKKNIEGYDKEVTSVRFAGATDQLITSSGDNKVRIVSADGKEIRVLPEVVEFVQSAATTADGKLVVAGGQDSVLRLWKAADGTAVLKFFP